MLKRKKIKIRNCPAWFVELFLLSAVQAARFVSRNQHRDFSLRCFLSFASPRQPPMRAPDFWSLHRSPLGLTNGQSLYCCFHCFGFSDNYVMHFAYFGLPEFKFH